MKNISSNLGFITCFSIMNSGKLAATVLIIKAIVVPMGRPLSRSDSAMGIIALALA
jgi:hypothetical protein